MDFKLTEEQLMIQKAAREFAQQQCLPGVIERDEQQKFPKNQIEQLADLGFLGMMTAPEFGGAGMDTVSYVLAMDEISKIDAMRITNLSDKTLKNITDALIKMGLLSSKKEGIIMMYYVNYPLAFSPILFPGLYPSDKEIDILAHL
jgi:hypothetical protein